MIRKLLFTTLILLMLPTLGFAQAEKKNNASIGTDLRQRVSSPRVSKGWREDGGPSLRLLTPHLNQKKGDATMTKAERVKVIKLLLDANKETLKAVEKLTDAQWNYKPAPEKWSAGEVAEHIWLAEGLLFGAMEKALSNPVNPKWEELTNGKDEFLEKILLNRQGKAQAPEAIKPANKTRAEVIKGLKDSRAKTLKFAKETKLALKEHTQDHPFKIFGTLNAYDWLIYIPLHNMRHNQQIAEVKSSPGFPK